MLLFPVIAAVATLILTGFFRQYAVRRALLDHPNHRSMHAAPTPRGGGIVIVLSVLAYLIYGVTAGVVDRSLGIALIGGGTMIAVAGSIDDVRSLSAEARFCVQLLAAVWSLWWLGWMPSVDVGSARLELGWIGGAAALLLIIWATNLYNFMDGIDGLASVEALFIAGFGGALLALQNAASLAGVSFVVFGAVLGFIYWNWEPARIFMGDVASGFLGFTFATLAVASENSGAVPLLVWFILASAFFMDASITLVRRMREGVWRHAHRTHAYQRAVMSGMTHSRVVLGIAALNLVLCALALIAVLRPPALMYAVGASAILCAMLYVAVGRIEPFLVERRPAE